MPTQYLSIDHKLLWSCPFLESVSEVMFLQMKRTREIYTFHFISLSPPTCMGTILSEAYGHLFLQANQPFFPLTDFWSI